MKNNKELKWCIGVESKITYETQLRSKFFDSEEEAKEWFNDNIVMFKKDSQAFIYCVVYNNEDNTYYVYSSEDI